MTSPLSRGARQQARPIGCKLLLFDPVMNMAMEKLAQLEHVPTATPQVNPTTPLETSVPQIQRPSTVAGGVPAVLSTTRYLLRETTLAVGLKVLRTVNQ